jgi:hypothetical protein
VAIFFRFFLFLVFSERDERKKRRHDERWDDEDSKQSEGRTERRQGTVALFSLRMRRGHEKSFACAESRCWQKKMRPKREKDGESERETERETLFLLLFNGK